MGLGYWIEDMFNDSYAEKKYESYSNSYRELMEQINKIASYVSIAETDFRAQKEKWNNMPDVDGVWVREYVERLDEAILEKEEIMQELKECMRLVAQQAQKLAESVIYWKEQMELEDKTEDIKTKEEYEGGRAANGYSGKR